VAIPFSPDGAGGTGVTPEAVLDALRKVHDPDLRKDIVSLGMIKDLRVDNAADGATVSFTFELTTPACPVRNQLENMARTAVQAVPGVKRVDLKMSASVRASTRQAPESIVPDVKNIVAVGSGKGGVGKSTVAANLAVALGQRGAKVGLLDADIYGPTIPAMMGTRSKPRYTGDKLIPLEAYGIKMMSLGLLTDTDTPVIWRGPLVGGAVRQMLTDVDWGELDYLIIDLPPGTGDAPLTLIQTVPLTGAIIVTTPQDVALNIATKALAMFRHLHVHILGIVENMSYYVCPECGHRAYIFGHGGASAAAERLKVPFLGEIPLSEGIRETGDAGIPIVMERPQTAQAQAFGHVAEQLAAQISIRNTRVIPTVQLNLNR
jgi:ATP-binding protein involved in chromosome partitioning